jgi:hypothetical protein
MSGGRGEASREGRRGRLHCAAGVGFIINSNLSLILEKSSGRRTPNASMWLRACQTPTLPCGSAPVRRYHIKHPGLQPQRDPDTKTTVGRSSPDLKDNILT